HLSILLTVDRPLSPLARIRRLALLLPGPTFRTPVGCGAACFRRFTSRLATIAVTSRLLALLDDLAVLFHRLAMLRATPLQRVFTFLLTLPAHGLGHNLPAVGDGRRFTSAVV